MPQFCSDSVWDYSHCGGVFARWANQHTMSARVSQAKQCKYCITFGVALESTHPADSVSPVVRRTPVTRPSDDSAPCSISISATHASVTSVAPVAHVAMKGCLKTGVCRNCDVHHNHLHDDKRHVSLGMCNEYARNVDEALGFSVTQANTRQRKIEGVF
jgi:hypothetical protein